MTDHDAKLLALRVVRNNPSHALAIIDRYVLKKRREGVFPYAIAQDATVDLYATLMVEQDLKILLLYNGIHYNRLSVWREGGKIQISFADNDLRDYREAINCLAGTCVVYVT